MKYFACAILSGMLSNAPASGHDPAKCALNLQTLRAFHVPSYAYGACLTRLAAHANGCALRSLWSETNSACQGALIQVSTMHILTGLRQFHQNSVQQSQQSRKPISHGTSTLNAVGTPWTAQHGPLHGSRDKQSACRA